MRIVSNNFKNKSFINLGRKVIGMSSIALSILLSTVPSKISNVSEVSASFVNDDTVISLSEEAKYAIRSCNSELSNIDEFRLSDLKKVKKLMILLLEDEDYSYKSNSK